MGESKSAGISINELAGCLQGDILNSTQQTEDIVEHVMVGAMCPDPSPLYFELKPRKAVITRGDRADIQLGALETSTKCLILTGGHKPVPSVLNRAEEKGVPILLVDKDTPATLAELEQSFAQLEDETAESEPEE
jgi:BioD-like phosphotransacetylase family protein